MPRFSFFISHSKEPVTEDSRIWHEPIPLRLDALMKHDGEGNGESVSHAAYFRAAQTFLETNSFEVMRRAVSRQLNRDVKAPDIEEIRVYLEKHGEFYHPCRIETIVYQKQLSFVLNVAISETGRRFIEKEFHLLNRLNTEQPFHYLPQAYGFGRTAGSNGQKFAMFLGQWFDGYHEFHISIDPVAKKPKIMVWNDARGRFFLSAGQTKTLYAQVSKILTAYYNLESFEQIFSWHHAAGDFIVKTENEKLELRLVTVRRYAAIFENQKNTQTAPGDPQRILQVLLIFFLSLSIHMRLDRLDGIGEMVWSDSVAVEATLIGFLEALSKKPDVPSLPDSPLACFIAYMTSCTAGDLIDLTEAIVNRFNPQMSGLTVVKKNIHRHVETLHGSIQQILSMY
jgi:hypothetical protein